MRLLVCGGRHYANRHQVAIALGLAHVRRPITALIHGGATGADALAAEWAAARGIPCEPFPAAWSDLNALPLVLRYRRDGTPYNAAAGGIRNQRMVDEGRPDVVIAFRGGVGTADMIRRARAAGIEPVIFP